MKAVERVKKHLIPGHVYRRFELEKWSTSIDRHLSQLQKELALVRFSGGMYYCPKEIIFGQVPPEDKMLVRTFLKDKRFLLMAPHMYNSLGIGTTQLYNETIVYNHKRHGVFTLGRRQFRFVKKPYFPLKMSSEFLLVDLVDNIHRLAEDKEKVLGLVKIKAFTFDQKAFFKTVQNYGGAKAKKFFASLFNNERLLYAA